LQFNTGSHIMIYIAIGFLFLIGTLFVAKVGEFISNR
jgi:hypothetical protein